MHWRPPATYTHNLVLYLAHETLCVCVCRLLTGYPPLSPDAHFGSSRAMSMPELPHYSPEVLALWNEKDEETSEKWRQDKIKDFEAGGA